METWRKKGRKSVVGMCVFFVCLLVHGKKIKMSGKKMREREREGVKKWGEIVILEPSILFFTPTSEENHRKNSNYGKNRAT